MLVDVVVTDTKGLSIPAAVVDVLQANTDGFYDVQLPEVEGPVLGARFRTDDDGRLTFWTILPAPYPIPADGPVGRMPEAVGRHPMRAPRVHFMIAAPVRHTLVTQLFVEGGDHLAPTPSLGSRPHLSRRSPCRRSQRPTAVGAPGGG